MAKVLLGSIPLVVNGDKILLLKREKWPFEGHWALPGGKIMFGEHPEETAVRELKEETGIDAEVKCTKGIISEHLKNKETGEVEGHFVMFVCEMVPKHLDLVHSEEGELAWFSLGELDKIKIVPSDRLIIKEIGIAEANMEVHKSHVVKDGVEYYLEAFEK